MNSPQWHYGQASALMDMVVENKDIPQFTETSAALLLQSAQTHALLGILSNLEGS